MDGFTKFASNMREFRAKNYTILFSYNTPVAAFILGQGWYITEKKWSQTTSRHITKWLNEYAKRGAFIDRNVNVKTVSQCQLDSFFAGKLETLN